MRVRLPQVKKKEHGITFGASQNLLVGFRTLTHYLKILPEFIEILQKVLVNS